MTRIERSKHLAMLQLLDPIVAALRSNGLEASHYCPGYIEVKNHDFVFAPSEDRWLHKRTGDTHGSWIGLMDLQDDCLDAELVSNKILGCIRGRKEST